MTAAAAEESHLVSHARRELALAGLFDNDSDYGGMLGEAALDIVRLFSTQGHSGASAALVTDIAARLMRFEPLTPLTDDPEEWIDVDGKGLLQSRRDGAAFSHDGGKTYNRNGEEGTRVTVSASGACHA